MTVCAHLHPVRSPSLTDGEEPKLVQALVRGDDQAFDALVGRYHGDVRRLTQRLLGYKNAGIEDVVQEVFIAAWRKRKSFRGDAKLRTWLMGITLRQCRAWQRWAIKDRLHWLSRRTRSPGIDETQPDSAMDQQEQAAQVRDAVARLPGNMREVVVLRYLEQRPMDEVAGLLGLTRNAADVRLHRARKRLAQLLGSAAGNSEIGNGEQDQAEHPDER